MAFIVPPGGFAGVAQMTPASQRALSPGGSVRRSRRKRTKTKRTKRAGSKRRTKSKGRKPKFGSPAWRKRYMKK